MQGRLPNFLVIGAAKAGTTSLYSYLKEHPQIFMSPIKETKYFAYEGKPTKTFLGTNEHFPVTTIEKYMNLFEDATHELVIGEASPRYMWSPVAAERIKELIPEAKLLAVLRNPADRAFSDYMMGVTRREDKREMEDALSEDGHYIQLGFYHGQLKRYFDIFPRDQIKIYLFEELKQDTLSVMRDVFDYLGVDTTFEPDVISRHNVGGTPKNKTLNMLLMKIEHTDTIKTMAPSWAARGYRSIRKKNLGDKAEFSRDLRRRLIDIYRNDILNVQDLIQRDLTSWLES
ncbi:MAG: sulfotransferase domain-containing protein [Planctomycetes bacterium]|nr:sulfotransferase domain-containing protein [Planctomycetota bacterium]